MAKKKGELTRYKVKSKKLNIVKLAIIVIAVLVVLYFVLSAVKIFNLNSERERIEKENEELRETVEDLKQQMEIIHTDQYMEGLARKKLKLVRSNEILFVLPDLRAGDEDNEDSTFKSTTDKAKAEAEELKKAQEAQQAEAGQDSKEGEGADQAGADGESSGSDETKSGDGNGR